MTRPALFILRPGPTFPAVLANAIAFLGRLPTDKAWSVEVKPHSERRSDQQNRYLWGVCYPALAAHTGHDPEDLHEFLLGEHFGWESYEVMTMHRKRPQRRSSKMSRAEFAEYVEFVQRKAANIGCYIPDPDPMMEAA
jgi:hypothetical protein